MSISFDFDKHYTEIYHKYKQFLKDFELEDYVDLKYNQGKNNCKICHFRANEPFQHKLAKEKIFKLFLKRHDYLVESEVSAAINKGELEVFDVGKRGYALDVLVINVKNLIFLFNYVEGNLPSHKDVNLDYLRQMEYDIMFAVEVDGDIHSWKKDRLRDKFFMEQYNITTVRYDVSDLVRIYKKYKGKSSIRKRMNNFTKETSLPELYNITIEQILEDCKAYYYKKYRNLLEIDLKVLKHSF